MRISRSLPGPHRGSSNSKRELPRALKVLQLDRHGWPPTFIAIYDEAWVMARQDLCADVRRAESLHTSNKCLRARDAAEVMREATGNSGLTAR